MFDVSLHYHTLGFVRYLGFHLTLLVDTPPLCQLTLLVGSEGFCRALATSCVRRKRTSVRLLHLSLSDTFHIIGLRVTLALD